LVDHSCWSTAKNGVNSVNEALALDRANINTVWPDTVAKEMKNIRMAFKILDEGEMTPTGHQEI
jgi:hypothetical protein